MSIFSHIRRSRQQAKEHSAKVAEQKKKETAQVPYRHVPTHAAIDAISSAPPSWREADRPKIQEQNRRRSAMAAARGLDMSTHAPQTPRGGSSLSHVSFPSGDATPVVPRMPRAYSYSGYASAGRQVMYSIPDVAYSQPVSLKGKEVERAPYCGSPRISPSSSKGDPRPVESSSDSLSSQEVLELKAARRPQSSGGRPFEHAAAVESLHRLHPSRRRLSDASVDKMSTWSKPSNPRDHRPPVSMRGFDAIPPVPPVPAIPSSHLRGSSVGSVTSSVGGHASGQSTPRITSPRHSSTSSFAASTPVNPVVPDPAAPPETHAEDIISSSPASVPMGALSLGFDFGEAVTSAASTPPAPESNDGRMPKTTRFMELEETEHSIDRSYFDAIHSRELEKLPPMTSQQAVDVVPQPAPGPIATIPTSKRFSKGGIGGRLFGKNRASVAA